MEKTWTYEEITKIAEARIDQKARLAAERKDLQTEYFSQACEVHAFWFDITGMGYKQEDYERLIAKVNDIL